MRKNVKEVRENVIAYIKEMLENIIVWLRENVIQVKYVR